MLNIILASRYSIEYSYGGLSIDKLNGEHIVFVQGDEASSLFDELMAAPTDEAISIIIEAYVTA